MKANALNAVPASANAPAVRSLCNFCRERQTLLEQGFSFLKTFFRAANQQDMPKSPVKKGFF
jgi:hypothetical protein